MVPAKFIIKFVKGDTYQISLNWSTKPEGWIDGDPLIGVDLTGAVIRLQVRSEYGSEVVLYEASTVNGHITIDVDQVTNTGDFYLEIPALISGTFTFEDGVYDLEVNLSGKVSTILKGSFILLDEITQ